MSVTTDRVLDLSEGGFRLRAENRQLILERKDEEARSVPFEEVAVLIVSNAWTTYSHSVLTTLAETNGILVVCDSHSLPIAMTLPLQGNVLHAECLRAQVQASKPAQKRLWQQIVKAKVAAQATVLLELHGEDGGLKALLSRVGSGDPENVEAQAARKYWPALFKNLDFRREPQGGEPPNHLLNYGYAVLRGIVARAVVGAGLSAAFGIHHHNRSNSFCLADDLMEPFRPIVDRQVALLVKAEGKDVPLDKRSKALMLSPLLGRLTYEGERRTLFDVLSKISAGLVSIYAGVSDSWIFPEDTVAVERG
jgi:CRISPR-associated protein Cas1